MIQTSFYRPNLFRANNNNNSQYGCYPPPINPNDPMAGNKMLGMKMMQMGRDLSDDGMLNGSCPPPPPPPPPPPMNPMKKMMKMMKMMMQMMMQMFGLGNQQYNNNNYSNNIFDPTNNYGMDQYSSMYSGNDYASYNPFGTDYGNMY